ncbi:MAG: PfkB family carbohydrate kinase [Treponema sp.]|jgi:sugar/nucleoside kinase (ribokinase family)|nr:PfkB family carbohydrate kinase [Treponema sp.]
MGREKRGLLCVGNAMVDVFASLDEGEARRLGLTEPVQHPDYETTSAILRALPEPLITAGGGAATVAKIAALLGVPARFIGAVGASAGGEPDAFGRLFEKGLTQAGVRACLSPVNLPTGLCLIITLPGGETRIAASPSAALRLAEAAIPRAAMQEAAVLVLDGFMLGREGLVRHLLRGARRCGTVAALDLGSPAIAAAWAGKIARYCRDYPLILFMNEDEAEAFCRALEGKRPAPNPSPGEDHKNGLLSGRMQGVLSALKGSRTTGEYRPGEPFPLVVVKRGPRGAVVFTGDRVYPAGTTALIPGESTGAGDAFAAAFLAALIRRRPLAECADLGNRTAREVLDAPGSGISREKLEPIAKTL